MAKRRKKKSSSRQQRVGSALRKAFREAKRKKGGKPLSKTERQRIFSSTVKKVR